MILKDTFNETEKEALKSVKGNIFMTLVKDGKEEFFPRGTTTVRGLQDGRERWSSTLNTTKTSGDL